MVRDTGLLSNVFILCMQGNRICQNKQCDGDDFFHIGYYQLTSVYLNNKDKQYSLITAAVLKSYGAEEFGCRSSETGAGCNALFGGVVIDPYSHKIVEKG